MCGEKVGCDGSPSRDGGTVGSLGGTHMKRGIIAAAALAVALIGPGAHADHGGVECTGRVDLGGIASCESRFAHSQKTFVSVVDTHANFHEFQSRGYITMEWFDARGNLIVAYGCLGNGLPGDGLLDRTHLVLCNRYGNAEPYFYTGTQTFRVTAYNTGCATATCTFHGRLRLSTEGDLY